MWQSGGSVGQGLLQEAGILKGISKLGFQSGYGGDSFVQSLLNQMAEALPAHLLSMTVPRPPDDGCMTNQKGLRHKTPET